MAGRRVVGNYTYLSKNGCSTVDLIWCDMYHLDVIDDLKVANFVTLSDHFPLELCIYNYDFNLSVSRSVSTPSNFSMIRFNKSLAEDFSALLMYSNKIVVNFQNDSLDSLYHNFVETILEVSSNLGMVKNSASGNISRNT